MPELPHHATERSHELLAIAREVADRCPTDWQAEVSVSGSISKGFADQYSDIELDFWVATLPIKEAATNWLHEIGATEIEVEDPVEAEGYCLSRARYGKVWLETAWQEMAAADRTLNKVLAGESDSHEDQMLAELLAYTVPLHTDGWLTEWQSRLQHYPLALQARLIATVTEKWANPIAAEVRWAILRREQYISLSESLLFHVIRMIRVLFAVNQQWEPDTKWIANLQDRLTLKPADLMPRINTVLLDPNPEVRVVTMLRLMVETLDLVPADIDVSAARIMIAQSLTENGYQQETAS